MKNIISLLIFIFALFIMSNVESNGQCASCPSGYTGYSLSYVIPATSCTITVNYCLLCSPTGNPVVRLCSIEVPHISACNNLILNSGLWDMIRTQTLKDAVNYCTGIPPCPTRKTMELYQADCFKLENDYINGRVLILPCDAEPGECYQEYEICWESGNLNISKVGTPILTDEGDCGPEFIEIDPDDLFEGCFSTCN
jgi:hypothetical protein